MSGAAGWVAAIAWRFLRGSGSRLLRGTALAALGATAVGVAAMIIAMALMTGYREDIEQKIARGDASIVVYSLGAGATPEATARALRAVEGVGAVRRVVYGQGTLTSAARPEGVEVTVRGIDPAEGVPDLGELDWLPGRSAETLAGGAGAELLVGADLARHLEIAPDEPLRLMVVGFEGSRPRFRYVSARVAARFETGFSEFDRSWVVFDAGRLQELLGSASTGPVWELGPGPGTGVPELTERLRAVLGDEYLVSDWRDLNRELFTALAVQQVALFLVLGLIVLVATFNVGSTLMVLVRERMRDLGLLASLGMSPSRLRLLFLFYGGFLGAAGTALGVIVGTSISWLLTRYEIIRFDPEVAAIYFVSSVTFRVRPLDVAAVAGFALVVTLLTCWRPATRAGSILPADALRAE